ncbi:actin 2 [Perkinsela sp. CCAP 1560/4]|nr:actin 2 [Perkinsela sp. CCAP 1560/4]|eukprot:KNH07646.1 actin 2 [Perkinsela sp. CCAP 1560/4]
MEQRKAVIFSCGRSHYAEGVSGESYPTTFVSRNGQPNESPGKLYDDISGSVELMRSVGRECEQAVICESPYLRESKTLLQRYEEHLDFLLGNYFERVLVINTPLSSLFGAGLLDGVVADLGHTQSTVVLCESGEVVFSSAHATPFDSHTVKHNSCFLQQQADDRIEDDREHTTRNFHRKMMESVLCDKVAYQLPDGAFLNGDNKNITISPEEAVLPHDLLSSSANAKFKQVNDFDTVVEHVIGSCKNCFERQTRFSKHLVPCLFAGGRSQNPVIEQRVVEEFERDNLEFPVFSPVNTTNSEKQYQPQTLGYKGASILGEFLTQSSYISKKEYAEHGRRIVNIKCMNMS